MKPLEIAIARVSAERETDQLTERYLYLTALQREIQLEVAIARAVLQVDAHIWASTARSEARMRARGEPQAFIDALWHEQVAWYAADFPGVCAQIRDIFTRESGGAPLLAPGHRESIH